MSKWNLIVDVGRCDNCRLCFLAVKDEYIGNDHPGRLGRAARAGTQLAGHQAQGARHVPDRPGALPARDVQPLR